MKAIQYIPEVFMSEKNTEEMIIEEAKIIGDAPCFCYGFITIPNEGDALAYSCPICF